MLTKLARLSYALLGESAHCLWHLCIVNEFLELSGGLAICTARLLGGSFGSGLTICTVRLLSGSFALGHGTTSYLLRRKEAPTGGPGLPRYFGGQMAIPSPLGSADISTPLTTCVCHGYFAGVANVGHL